MGDFIDYIPFVVGAGLFLGAILSGMWKGKQDAATNTKEIIAGTIQDNHSMLMLTEQLRNTHQTLERLIHAVEQSSNETERLREYARDITKVLETRLPQ